MSDETPLPATTVTPEDYLVLQDYQQFLTRHGLARKLLCGRCGQPADPGTGQIGWKCACRLLVWRLM